MPERPTQEATKLHGQMGTSPRHETTIMEGNRKGDIIQPARGTPRDTGAWFKNILHRALWLKGKGGVRHVCQSCENPD